MKLDPGADERHEVGTVDPPPATLCHGEELEGHEQALPTRTRALGHALAQAHRSEGRLGHIARSQVEQCSAGKSKKVSSSASSRRSEATAFGYLAP